MRKLRNEAYIYSVLPKYKNKASMQKHVKIYLKSRGLTTADFIKCEECGAKAVDIHHIIPRSRASKDIVNHPDNLQALCRECHKRKHE